MLVNITEHFIEAGREWQVGQNPDVPREVAARWIADGKATADTDGARNQSPVSGGGVAAQSSPLVKQSKVMLDYASTAITFGYTAATPVIDTAYARYSVVTRRLDLSASSAQIRRGSAALTVDPVDKMMSLHIYLPFAPVSGGAGHSINVGISNEAANGSNIVTFSFDSGYLRQGWNDLRMWADDTTGASGTGTLAYGASKTVAGTGCDFSAAIGSVYVTFNNMSGKSVYLCSLRRSAKAKPALVMGFDATGANSGDTVFTGKLGPLFAGYGYKSYFTVTWIWDQLYAGSPDYLRKRVLYDTYGWDSLVHTWSHGGSAPGGTQVVTATLAADVVTVTKSAHGYTIGERIYASISGATPSAVNGVWLMTVTTTDALTYTATGAGTSAVTGTITWSTLIADVVAAPGAQSQAILRHELVDLANVMRSVGWNRGAAICAYPNNSCPELETAKLISAESGIKLARGIKGGTVKISEFGIDNPLHFGSVEMGSGTTATTLEYVKNKLSGAIGRGEHMWTYGHYILDDTDPANAAYAPVDNNNPPGSSGNPNPPAGGTQGSLGGWWYYSTLVRFLAEAVAPAVASGNLKVFSPTEWAAAIGVSA